jgi:hypothetical protein
MLAPINDAIGIFDLGAFRVRERLPHHRVTTKRCPACCQELAMDVTTLPANEKFHMYRRRGRTVGTIVVGAIVVAAIVYAASGGLNLNAMHTPFVIAAS